MKRTALFFALGLMASVVGVNAQNKDNPVVVISSESVEHDYGDVVVIHHVQKENDADVVIMSMEDQPLWVEILNAPESRPDNNGVFQVVEQQPEFPGGMAELMKYLEKNLRYPQICKEQGVQGRVIVQFVVNTDSTITDVNVIKSVNPYLDEEALRVVKAMPKWAPGTQYGKPVRVRFTLPVTFRLPKDTVKVDTVSVNRK